MKYLVTGGAGFIGSNLVRHLLTTRDDVEVVNLDALTYAGNQENLTDLAGHPRYRFVHGDICDPAVVTQAMDGADVVVHLAAESHVDRSIVADTPFVRTNVVGTHMLLAAALLIGVKRFVQVSTDEVYGELPWRDPALAPRTTAGAPDFEADDAPYFTEQSPLAPRSPYSATKAAGDHLALAYHATHGLDVVLTRCSNNYGAYQFPEKLIPLVITRVLEDRPIPVYGDGLYVRDWIHVDDHCRAIVLAAERGRAGRVYNFAGGAERTNLAVVDAIRRALKKPGHRIEHVRDRPGHDRRYAVDYRRATAELGWSPRRSFEEGLAQTAMWYLDNEAWWMRVLSGEYRRP